MKQKANKETEKNAKEYWDDYYEAMDEKLQGIVFGASEDGSTIFSEDFENLDQRDLRTDDRDDKWHVKQDIDGNSMYCNKKVTADDYAEFNLGRENWRDYSISYRMKFTTGKGGTLQTHIRKNSNRQGEYRSYFDSVRGNTFLKYVKGADGIRATIGNGSIASIGDKWADIQLIASGKNIFYIINGKVVACAKDDRLKKGAAMFAVTSHSELCLDDIVVLKSNKKVNLDCKVDDFVVKKVNPDGKKISKYQNGKTKSEEHYKDGKKEGKFTTWYQSGEIKSETNYKNNLREGKGTSWYVNGQKKAETNYKDGKKEGKFTTWLQSGEIKLEINYKNNSREGKSTSWYVNGQKNAEINYKNGNKEGKSSAWHDNGQIKLEESYIDNKREGIRTTWYINGQKMYEDNFKNGKLDGKKTQWHDNGQIKSEDNYKDGKRI